MVLQWRDKQELLTEVNKYSLALLQSSWKDDSCWKWLIYLETQMREFRSEKRSTDVDGAYFYSMVHTIDFDLLQKIKNSLRNCIDTMVSERVVNVTNINLTSEFKDSLKDACKSLQLSEKGLNVFVAKTTLLSSEKQDLLLKNLAELGILYDGLHVLFSLTAALLLYYRPSQTFANFDSFKQALNDTSAKKKDLVLLWAPIFRYLAQGFFCYDGDIKDEAVFYLTANPIQPVSLKNKIYHLFYRTLLFVGFKNFSYIEDELLKQLVKFHLWWAIDMGLPVEFLIKEKLADQPLLDMYINLSGTLAESLLQSDQLLFLESQDKVTINQFITKFTSQNTKKDFDQKNQKTYVEAEVKLHYWPLESIDKLLRILSLYIHLRECTLIDYRGMLEDEGARKAPYNFKELMQKDLTEMEKQNIHEYFRLLHRAFKLKIELIVAFQSVEYQEEPFFSRMLTFNDLYSEVYPEPYGPLVLFDENTGEWKFRKEFPPGPWKIAALDIKDEDIPQDNTFSSSEESNRDGDKEEGASLSVPVSKIDISP